jgi:hypothetical protein
MSDDYVSIHLREKESELKDFLARAGCKDFTDYSNICGQIRGLRYSLEYIEEMRKKMEEEESKK